MEAPWDNISDEELEWNSSEGDNKVDRVDLPHANVGEKKAAEEGGMKADRRYTGGQARRIRKERERSAQKRALRRLRKRPGAVRKPENDIPDDAGN